MPRSYLLLYPLNYEAVEVVRHKKNSRFRVPVHALPPDWRPYPTVVRHNDYITDTLLVNFNHRGGSDGLIHFGIYTRYSKIVLTDIVVEDQCRDSSCHMLCVDPDSLELVLQSKPSLFHDSEVLYDLEVPPEGVGRWRARGDKISEQVIPHYSISALRLCDAIFAIVWNKPSQAKERDIKAAKEAFVQRARGQRRRIEPGFHEEHHERALASGYPEQSEYNPTMSPRAILTLPMDIRYIILRLLLVKEVIDFKPWKFQDDKLFSVGWCLYLLNKSHQLLNPLYSSPELATEAADIFYRQNLFSLRLDDVSYFIRTLMHMPSLGSFNPLTAISRLHISSSCGCPEDDDQNTTPEQKAAAIYKYHKWSESQCGDLINDCTELQTRLPGLKEVEIYFTKFECSDMHEAISGNDPRLRYYDIMRPAIRELMKSSDRSVKVFLRRWRHIPAPARSWIPKSVTEDITSWWRDSTNEDARLETMENIDWLGSIKWSHCWDDEVWIKKGVIEGARMRRLLARRALTNPNSAIRVQPDRLLRRGPDVYVW